MTKPKQGETYQHFKGKDKLYEIITVAKDCNNLNSKFVIYRSLYDRDDNPKGTVFSRPLKEFCGYKKFDEDCEFGKKGEKVKRFVLIKNLENKLNA